MFDLKFFTLYILIKILFLFDLYHFIYQSQLYLRNIFNDQIK